MSLFKHALRACLKSPESCTRQDRSPAIIVCPSEATAQLDMAPSPAKAAISSSLSKSLNLSVRSFDAEREAPARRKPTSSYPGPVFEFWVLRDGKNPIPKTLSRACSFCFGAFRCAQGMEAIIELLGQCQILSPLRYRQFGSEIFRTDEHRVIHDDSMEGVRDVFERGLNALNFEMAGAREKIYFDPARSEASRHRRRITSTACVWLSTQSTLGWRAKRTC